MLTNALHTSQLTGGFIRFETLEWFAMICTSYGYLLNYTDQSRNWQIFDDSQKSADIVCRVYKMSVLQNPMWTDFILMGVHKLLFAGYYFIFRGVCVAIIRDSHCCSDIANFTGLAMYVTILHDACTKLMQHTCLKLCKMYVHKLYSNLCNISFEQSRTI